MDLGDLQEEKEHLKKNLQSHLNVDVFDDGVKLAVDQEKVSMTDLHHAVKRFVNGRGFNATHWISIEGSTVKIKRFKGHEKNKGKHKKEPGHQNITQSWGL